MLTKKVVTFTIAWIFFVSYPSYSPIAVICTAARICYSYSMATMKTATSDKIFFLESLAYPQTPQGWYAYYTITFQQGARSLCSLLRFLTMSAFARRAWNSPALARVSVTTDSKQITPGTDLRIRASLRREHAWIVRTRAYRINQTFSLRFHSEQGSTHRPCWNRPDCSWVWGR